MLGHHTQRCDEHVHSEPITNNFQAHVIPRNQVIQPAKRRQRPQPTHVQRATIDELNEPRHEEVEGLRF